MDQKDGRGDGCDPGGGGLPGYFPRVYARGELRYDERGRKLRGLRGRAVVYGEPLPTPAVVGVERSPNLDVTRLERPGLTGGDTAFPGGVVPFALRTETVYACCSQP